MSATSRELVHQTLDMDGPARAPRSLRVLSRAAKVRACELIDIEREYPFDLVGVEGHEHENPPSSCGDYAAGASLDSWGCALAGFSRYLHPLIRDWKSDLGKVRIPREWLTIDVDAVNRDCASTDKFTLPVRHPSPFEQLQLMRGPCNLLADLLDPPRELLALMREIHAFYTELLNRWAKTDVDGLYVVDDWGSDRSLTISPSLWREYLRPLYRDYVQIAHQHDKRILFHSDGNILEIFSDLIEMGVDAINSQIFFMGLPHVRQYAGKITFWGDMDQRALESGPSGMDAAVREVYTNLWSNGGCIAHCEFGPGAKPENLRRMYATWADLTGRRIQIR